MVPHPRPRGDPAVRELDGGGQPLTASGGQGVHYHHQVGVDQRGGAADQLPRLHPRLPQDPRNQGRQLTAAQGGEQGLVVVPQVAGGGEAADGVRTDGVGGHLGVAQPHRQDPAGGSRGAPLHPLGHTAKLPGQELGEGLQRPFPAGGNAAESQGHRGLPRGLFAAGDHYGTVPEIPFKLHPLLGLLRRGSEGFQGQIRAGVVSESGPLAVCSGQKIFTFHGIPPNFRGMPPPFFMRIPRKSRT